MDRTITVTGTGVVTVPPDCARISFGVQVQGGVGFIEQTGAAQHFRDARIITIYEGTTGIQANDLIGRKTARDAGAVAKAVAGETDKAAARLAAPPTRSRKCTPARCSAVMRSIAPRSSSRPPRIASRTVIPGTYS